MEQDYLIAGHRIRIQGKDLLEALAPLPAFIPFRTSDGGTPVGEFIVSSEDGPTMTNRLYCVEVYGTFWRFGRYADGYAFEIESPAGELLRLWTIDNRIYLSGVLQERLLHFACWMGFGLLVAERQTMSVHTSAIVYRDNAVLFLGESGTGKSTHTRLWRENIEGAFLLNDASPFVRIVNGKPYVYGSPWSGKTPCYRNECYPIAACVRLSQAPYNKIERLPILQAYAALHPSCPPAFAYDESLYDVISQILDNMLSQVPVFHLNCLPNAEAARLSCKTIFGV